MKKIILIGFVFLLLISSVLSFNTIEEARVDLEVYYNGSVHPTTGNAIEGKDGNGGLANFGNAASTTGKLDVGFVFDGTGDYFKNSSSNMWTVDQPVQGFTICAWTNSDNDPTDQTPVSLDKGAWADYGTDNGASITYASGGGGNWQVHAGGIQENSGTNTAASTWYYLCIVGNASGTFPYSNGAQDCGGGSCGNAPSQRSGTDGLVIGARVNGVTQQFDGMVDELAVWNRSLNTVDIAFMYNGGTGRSLSNVTAPEPPVVIPPRNETISYTALINETQNHTISVLLENYNITSSAVANLIYRSKVYGTTLNYTNHSHVRFHGYPIAPLVVTNNTNQTFFFNYTLPHNTTYIEKNQSTNLSHRIQHAYFLTGSQVFGGIETLKQNFNVTMTSAHVANTELIGYYDGSLVTEFEDRTYGFIMNVTPPLITSNNTQLYANATLNVSYGYHNQYNLLRTPQTFNHWVLWIAWLKNATLSSTFTETETVTETSYVERYNGLTLPFTPNLNYIFDNIHRPASYSSNKFEIDVTCPLIEFNHTTKAATVSMNMTYNGVTKSRALTMNTTPLNTSVDWGYWIVSSSILSNITETVTQRATTTLNSFYKAALNLNYNYNEQYTASTNSSATNFITSLTAPRVTVATLINYSVDMNVTFNGITFVRNFTFS